MNDQQKVAIVTGANRGLGLEASRELARKGISVILTSRSVEKGEAALRQLQAEGMELRFHQLDVTDDAGVKQLADFVSDNYGRLDILINNAGVFLDPMDPEDESVGSLFKAEIDTVRTTFETNTLGPLRLAQTLIPLMKGAGRVVNVSSGMGQLAEMNGCCPGYRLSKTALNAVTRILADELKDTKVKVNSLCPGWVRTDMGGENADRSIQEGVDTIVWLALLQDDGPSGGFFRDRKPIPW